MSADPLDLEAIFDRIEAGKRLSQKELKILVAAARSQQLTIATAIALWRLEAVQREP